MTIEEALAEAEKLRESVYSMVEDDPIGIAREIVASNLLKAWRAMSDAIEALKSAKDWHERI